MRVGITAGLGDSGHQTVARAIAATGRSRGHHCEKIEIWPHNSRVSSDVLFGLYRRYAETGLPSMPSTLGAESVVESIVQEMVPRVEVDADIDTIVATHATDADVLSAWAERSDFKGQLVVVHTDFTPFPVRALNRVDFFVGVIASVSAGADIRRRQHPIGFPVLGPDDPDPSPATKRGRLVVTAGAVSSRSTDELIELGNQLSSALPDAMVEVCLGRPDGTDEARRDGVPPTDEPGVRVGSRTSLAPLLATARIVVTKPSGATLAEAFALGAVPVLSESVIPWERKAVGYLAQLGVVVLPRFGESMIDCVRRLWNDDQLMASAQLAGRSLDLGQSSTRLWDLIEGSGGPARPFTAAEIDLYGRVRAQLRTAVRAGDPLSRTAVRLGELLDGHFGWHES